MTPYLFLTFGAVGAEDLYVLRCADDAEARAKADWLLGLHPGRLRVEAWDEDRLVGATRPALALVPGTRARTRAGHAASPRARAGR